MSDGRPPYLDGNVSAWQAAAAEYAGPAEQAWASATPYWGVFEIPDAGIGLLPGDMQHLSCIELGCGTGYVSAWMARRGAKVTAIDPTPAQLDTARRLRAAHGLEIDFAHGYAEQLDYPDEAFDFAISEYGAAVWSDPYRWIPEAARVLKPGGTLTFLTNSPLSVLCLPETEAEGAWQTRLQRPYFGLHETTWPDAPGQTEFHLAHGDWVAVLRANGLFVERLIELQVPADATTRFAWADAAWASRWPCEEVWVARKVSPRPDGRDGFTPPAA